MVMLGAKEPLTWKQTEDGLVINLPEAMKAKQLPGDVYVFKMKGEAQPITPAPQVGTADEAAAKAKVIAGLSGIVTIQPAEPGSVIRYTTDGTEPDRQSSEYKGPITVSKSGVIKAVAYAKGKMPSDLSELRIVKGKYAISIMSRYAQQYGAYGPVTLVDGMAGDPQNYRKGWLGFEGVAMEAVIDLGVPTTFRKISASFLRNHGAWIFLPRQMKVMVSDDGANFKDLGVSALPAPVAQESNGSTLATVSQSAKARYIKLVAENIGQCPSWHPGAGGKAWIFADEVTVE
jgi:hypothetical protein